MTPAQDPKQGQNKKIQKNTKVNHQELIIFKGFRPNGLQIRIQRKKIRILNLFKIIL